jgi:hypothetical protein
VTRDDLTRRQRDLIDGAAASPEGWVTCKPGAAERMAKGLAGQGLGTMGRGVPPGGTMALPSFTLTPAGKALAKTPAVARSAGHVCFTSDGAAEFFQVGTEVYQAPTSAPLADAGDTRRHGRWECSRTHFDRYRSVIVY